MFCAYGIKGVRCKAEPLVQSEFGNDLMSPRSRKDMSQVDPYIKLFCEQPNDLPFGEQPCFTTLTLVIICFFRGKVNISEDWVSGPKLPH